MVDIAAVREMILEITAAGEMQWRSRLGIDNGEDPGDEGDNREIHGDEGKGSGGDHTVVEDMVAVVETLTA